MNKLFVVVVSAVFLVAYVQSQCLPVNWSAQGIFEVTDPATVSAIYTCPQDRTAAQNELIKGINDQYNAIAASIGVTIELVYPDPLICPSMGMGMGGKRSVVPLDTTVSLNLNLRNTDLTEADALQTLQSVFENVKIAKIEKRQA